MPIGPDEFYGDKPKRREKWMLTLPRDVRTATDLSCHLKDALKDNKVGLAAELIATCIKTKVWETIAEYDDDQPEIKTYHPMQWCREVLKSEPDELMKIVASPLPRPETGAAAAIELIRLVREFEPLSLNLLTDESSKSNWRELLRANELRQGGPWIEAYAELDRISAQSEVMHAGKPPTDPDLIEKAQKLYSELHSHRKVANVLGVSPSCIINWLKIDLEKHRTHYALFHKRKSAHYPVAGTSREYARRRLEKFLDDPQLCSKHSTTVEAVRSGLQAFLSGSTATAALRIAGLKKPKEPEIRLRIKQDKSNIAQRILELLKPEETRELIAELTKAVENADTLNA